MEEREREKQGGRTWTTGSTATHSDGGIAGEFEEKATGEKIPSAPAGAEALAEAPDTPISNTSSGDDDSGIRLLLSSTPPRQRETLSVDLLQSASRPGGAIAPVTTSSAKAVGGAAAVPSPPTPRTESSSPATATPVSIRGGSRRSTAGGAGGRAGTPFRRQSPTVAASAGAGVSAPVSTAVETVGYSSPFSSPPSSSSSPSFLFFQHQHQQPNSKLKSKQEQQRREHLPSKPELPMAVIPLSALAAGASTTAGVEATAGGGNGSGGGGGDAGGGSQSSGAVVGGGGFPTHRAARESGILVPSESLDRSCAFVVFVSHRWVADGGDPGGGDVSEDGGGAEGGAGGMGACKPDVGSAKHALVLEGLSALMPTLPRGVTVYVWIDCSCIDQVPPTRPCYRFCSFSSSYLLPGREAGKNFGQYFPPFLG